MSTQQPTLLGRTLLPPGESLPSLLVRLAKLNYPDSPGILHQLLQEEVDGQPCNDRVMLPRQAMMFQRIATLTGFDISAIYECSNHHFAEILTPPEQAIDVLEITNSSFVPLLSPSIAAKQLRTASARQFCPGCLREAAYHRLIWMPLAVSACLKHKCLLVDRCQQCGKAVSIQDITENRCCKCANNLSETEMISLENDDGLSFQSTLQSWFMESMTPDESHILPEEHPRVLYRVLDGLQWAIRMLDKSKWTYLHRIPKVPTQGQFIGRWELTPDTNYCFFTTAFKGIINWPEGFYQFLDAYRSQMCLDKSLGDGPKADLGNLYTQWLQDYWQHPAFEFIHNVFEHYFVRSYALSSAVVRTTLCKERPDMMKQFSHVNIAEAARLLETTPTMINILLRTGRLSNQTHEQNCKRKYMFVSRKEVLELKKVWNESVNRVQTAKWLGTTKRMVVDLVNVGLLSADRCPTDGYPFWAFSRSAILQYIESVSRHVGTCPQNEVERGDSMVNLADAARILFVVGLNAVTILSTVAEGKLGAFVIEGQELKLGSLLFNRSDIEQYIYKIKSVNNWVNREELKKLLKVKDVTLTRWVKNGLISPTTVCGNAQYFDRDTVEKFMRDHISTDEAAKILSMGKLTVQKWARLGRFSGACISGPNIDGYHSYLFNKASLIQWQKERLPFGAAVRLLGVSKATLHRWIGERKIEPLEGMGGKQRWFSKEAVLVIRENTKQN